MYILKFHHISSEKKNLVLSRLTHFFVLRKFFAYFFILYALPLSSLVSIISYQDEIITVYARLYVSKSRNSGPPSSNRPFNENFIQGHFFKKNYWYQYVCTYVYIFPSSLQVLQESRSLLMKVFFLQLIATWNTTTIKQAGRLLFWRDQVVVTS